MPQPDSSLRIQEGLVPRGTPPADRIGDAETRLRAALDEVNALDAEIDELSARLEAFTRRHDAALRAAYAELERAERFVRRVQSLQDGVRKLTELLRSPPEEVAQGEKRSPPAARAKRIPPPPPEPEPEPEPDVDAEPGEGEEPAPVAGEREDEARILKRLLRRLARVVHPDLARDDAERERLHHLMAQVNAAYERGDRAALELMAEKVGAGEPLGELSEEERLAHLAKRTEALVQVARSLRLERDRLRATGTFRLLQEAEKREAAGRDYFEETRRELEGDERGALEDAWARICALERAVRELNVERERQAALAKVEKAKGGGALRAFDPVLESPLVRKGAARLEIRGASAEARRLARELEEEVEARPWSAALTLLAYFCELAGGPPDTLRDQPAWRECYDALRASWPEAPAFERALSALPPHLELGLRHQSKQVHFGLQLRSADLLPGVAIALERAAVARLGRAVLLELGPKEKCRGCGEQVRLVHLLRTRGLDELHALVCPRCFAVQKRYFLFSRSDGLEALLPQAERLGLVVEQVVRFGGASIAFQLLADERPKLTAADVARRLHDCYFAPYKVEVPAEAVRLYSGKRELRGMDAVRGPLVAKLDRRAGKKDREVVELLRSRIERRFRPE